MLISKRITLLVNECMPWDSKIKYNLKKEFKISFKITKTQSRSQKKKIRAVPWKQNFCWLGFIRL